MIPIPEYLCVWGQLAREGRGDANARITGQRERLARQPSATQNRPEPHSNRGDEDRDKGGLHNREAAPTQTTLSTSG
ncbi:MAG: hypothetical protein CMM01_01855 [Rhodopirellula sp.]|nr:hypothetical protein [Rhodopirellula sp.]